MNSPAPNRYQIYGDFEFKDANDPKNTCSKTPKFAFGIKNNIKPSNIDVPGPGAYETDVIPTNQKNLAYGMGTDVRRGLNARNSHMFPGPGLYDTQDYETGVHVG
jgi:hypothetical protein